MTVKQLKDFLCDKNDNDKVKIDFRHKSEYNKDIYVLDRYNVENIILGTDFRNDYSPKMDDYVNTVELIATLRS